MVDQRAARRAALLRHGTTDHYLDPVLYDFEYRERVEDIAWYREQVGPQPISVLELGAGSGRITLPLLGDGHCVTAIDRVGPMLEHLRQKLDRQIAADMLPTDARERVTTKLGDIRKLDLPDNSFRCVLAPFNTLMHLYTTADLQACFGEIARVLQPGGVCLFDVCLPDFDWLMWDPADRHSVTPFIDPNSGRRMIYSTNHTYDYATQVCHIRIYYDPAPPAGETFVPPTNSEHVVHLAHRQIFPEELRALLPWAGLELVKHDGGFCGEPLTIESESQVCVARKAG